MIKVRLAFSLYELATFAVGGLLITNWHPYLSKSCHDLQRKTVDIVNSLDITSYQHHYKTIIIFDFKLQQNNAIFWKKGTKINSKRVQQL